MSASPYLDHTHTLIIILLVGAAWGSSCPPIEMSSKGTKGHPELNDYYTDDTSWQNSLARMLWQEQQAARATGVGAEPYFNLREGSVSYRADPGKGCREEDLAMGKGKGKGKGYGMAKGNKGPKQGVFQTSVSYDEAVSRWGSQEAGRGVGKGRGVARPRIPVGTYFWSTRLTCYYSNTWDGRLGSEPAWRVKKRYLDIPVGTLLGPSLGEEHTKGYATAVVKEPVTGWELSVNCWASCNGAMFVDLCRTQGSRRR